MNVKASAASRRKIIINAVLLAPLFACLFWLYQLVAAAGATGAELEAAKKIWALEEARVGESGIAEQEPISGPIRFDWTQPDSPDPEFRAVPATYNRTDPRRPTDLIWRIERRGIKVTGRTATNNYIIHRTWTSAGRKHASSTRIVHTWFNDGSGWRLVRSGTDQI